MPIKVAVASPTTLLIALLTILLSACNKPQIDNNTLTLAPSEHHASPQQQHYLEQVQPILNRRCVVCHACYDAPCQLKLSSAEGLERGATTQKVYDSSRLLAASPTRLNIDAQNAAQWQQKGFFSVLSTPASDAAENPNNTAPATPASLMRNMLSLKQAQALPLTEDGRLADVFNFTLNREWHCPTPEAFDTYAKKQPHGGMPFGLPGIPQQEYATLVNWLEAGAPLASPATPGPKHAASVAQWERFLNQDSLKGQLVARYIYEHLFIANLYFSELGAAQTPQQTPQFYQLMRSRTPPGQPIDVIATRRPFDNPNTQRVYYRLRPKVESVVAKTHIPLALNTQLLERWQTLFFNPNYQVNQLPGYSENTKANPFITFKQLPENARYRFMLEQAQFTIRSFMKGSVCRGQVALNVIDDYFWVFFVNPEYSPVLESDTFLTRHKHLLGLPQESTSDIEPLSDWLSYSAKQQAYLQEKTQLLKRQFGAQNKQLDLNYLWDGDGHNQNAALTAFRHFDSASVIKGMHGENPKTAWLIDYPILERIHYLLVAGFDVYGNLGHQLLTRVHMDFLRMESEFNFLALLPSETRTQLRNHWYRDADDEVKKYIHGEYTQLNIEPNLKYFTKQPKQELYLQIKNALAKVLNTQHNVSSTTLSPKQKQALQSIETIAGPTASLFPEMALLLFNKQLYTVLRHSAHSNISELFNERSRRLPNEDRLSVLKGVVGAYPDALWHVNSEELPEFIAAMQSVQTEQHYRAFMQRFGIRRSHPQFWQHSDTIHQVFQQEAGVSYGLLDYNRLENR